MTTPAATLRASLERHNEEFESLLKLIPARFYLVQDNEEQVCVSGLSGSSFVQCFCSVCIEVSETQEKQERRQAGDQGGVQKSQKSQSERGHVISQQQWLTVL